MSTIDVTDVRQFEPLVTKSVEMTRSSTEGLSCQDVLEKMSQKEENHKLSTPKIKQSKVRSMYKHQYMNEQGGVIIVKGTGVSLHIPPDALRERTFISIEVKSAADCDATGLDPSTIQTPIVSCQPDGLRFQKDVELTLPHCAEFDDIHLHKATARFVGGVVGVSKDSTNKQDQVRCVLKERYCHVYTTHFSDVVVGISNCLKKRMLVVPFSGGSTKLYVKVWIINDLPSEYTILLHEQKELNFTPFSRTGKFIFENHGQCSLKIQLSLEDRILQEVTKDIDIQRLFRNIRSVHDFEMDRTVTDASPKFVAVSLLKEPVFYLKKEIQDGDGFERVQEEICASDETKTQHGEAAQTQTESDDITQQIFTYQTDIFKAIGEFCTDVSKSIWNIGFPHRQHEHKSDLFTTVTSLQPVIFKKISSFSEDIFWKLSPDERELIKAISSFNTDIMERISTVQTEIYAALQRGGFYPWYTLRDDYKTVISLRTEIFERISTFIEGTLQMRPLMQADLLHKVKTLELAIFGRIEALPKDLRGYPYYSRKEFSSKMEKFSTELFQRVLSFYEDFLRLSPMGLDDIATKVTVLVQDLLQGISSFFKDIAPVLCLAYEDDSLRLRLFHRQGITAMLNSVHRGLFTDISTFMKGFQEFMPSFGEDLLIQISSLENDFLKLMSSLDKVLPKPPSLTRTDLSKQMSSLQNDFLKLMSSLEKDLPKPPSPENIDLPTPLLPLRKDLTTPLLPLRKDLPKPPSPASIDLPKPPSPASIVRQSTESYFSDLSLSLADSSEDSDEDSSYPSKDSLTKPFKSNNEPHKRWSYFKKEPPKSGSYFKKGGEEESSKPPESKRAKTN